MKRLSYLFLDINNITMLTQKINNVSEQKIWPRAAAAAERLWSNPSTRSNLAEDRFNRVRDRLVSRGIHPDATNPKWCKLNAEECQ